MFFFPTNTTFYCNSLRLAAVSHHRATPHIKFPIIWVIFVSHWTSRCLDPAARVFLVLPKLLFWKCYYRIFDRNSFKVYCSETFFFFFFVESTVQCLCLHQPIASHSYATRCNIKQHHQRRLHTVIKQHENVRMWDVRIKTLHAGRNSNLWEKDRKTNSQKKFWQDSSEHIFRCWWDSLKLFYKCCTSFDKTGQQLAQRVCDTLPYLVFKIVVFIICSSFDELLLASSSNHFWRDVLPAQPLRLDEAFDRWKKKIYLDLMHEKIVFAQCDIRYFVWKRSCPISSSNFKSAVWRGKKKVSGV